MRMSRPAALSGLLLSWTKIYFLNLRKRIQNRTVSVWRCIESTYPVVPLKGKRLVKRSGLTSQNIDRIGAGRSLCSVCPTVDTVRGSILFFSRRFFSFIENFTVCNQENLRWNLHNVLNIRCDICLTARFFASFWRA